MEQINFSIQFLREKFPRTQIYPSIGNHEAAPPDLFQPNNMSWLYEFIAEQWNFDQQTRQTFVTGGFYTAKITQTIRLISLNTNLCSASNYWLYINSTDPLGQLQWVPI